MARVLLIDDSRDVHELVKVSLGDRFRLTCASSASEAESALNNDRYDLILLDIMLPDKDGFKVCAELQNSEKTRNIPILFLSAKSDVSDKVLGFSLGADDYIVKPFDRMELKARVEAKLKKNQILKESMESIRAGDLLLQIPSQKAMIVSGTSERPIELTALEFRLLLHMTRNEGTVLTRDQLLTAIRGPDVHVLDRTIDRHIAALRKKLGPLSGYIESVHGVGYRFGVS